MLPASAMQAGSVNVAAEGRDASRHIDRAILPTYAQMLLDHVNGLTQEENDRQSRIMAERGLY